MRQFLQVLLVALFGVPLGVYAADQALPDQMEIHVGAVSNLADSVTLVLTKRSIRSERYQFGTFSETEGFKKLEPLPVTTYRGYVKEKPALRVNANIQPGGLLNVNFSDGGCLNFWYGKYKCVIDGLKIEIPEGKSTPLMSTGNKVVPLKQVRQRSKSGFMPPPVLMRRVDIAVEIQKGLLDDFGGDVATAVARAEQQINDVDMFYSRDVGIAVEVTTLIVRLDEGANFSRKVFEEVDGGRTCHLHTRFAGSKSRPNYFGGSIYKFAGAGLNVRGTGTASSGFGHELGHNFGGMHQVDPLDCMNGALSQIGMYNSQIMIRHSMSITNEAIFPAVVYNGVVQPCARDDIAVTPKDKAVTIDVLENDYDGNGDELTVEAVSEKSKRGGTIVITEDKKQVIYTPAPGFVGMDKFTYTIADGTGAFSETGLVTVRVDSPDGLACYFPMDENGPTRMVGSSEVVTYEDKGPFAAHGVPLQVNDDYGPAYRGGPNPISGELLPGVKGKALYNSKAGHRGVAVGFANGPDAGNGDLSVSLWVAVPSLAGGVIIGKGGPWFAGGHDASSGWAISLRGGRDPAFSFVGKTISKNFSLTATNSPVAINTWYHLAMVIDRNTKKMRAWVNGAEVPYAPTADIADGSIYDPNPVLLFNNPVWKRLSSMAGLVDEIRIYTRPLTAKEVAELYAEGKDAPAPAFTKLPAPTQ